MTKNAIPFLICYVLHALAPATQAETRDVIFFTSAGKTGMIRPDGTGKQVLDFQDLNQAAWQPSSPMPDRRRILLYSREHPKNPDASFYDKDGARNATIHIWMYDFFGESLKEIHLPRQMAVVGVLPGTERFLLNGEPDGDNKTKIMTCDFDGGDVRLVHDCGGFAYGFNIDPTGRYIAFHLCKNGYEIFTLELKTRTLRKLASDPDLLMFGPTFSPDGEWLVYQSCRYKKDSFHTRSDLRLTRPDGSETRELTTGQRQWFGTSYGPKNDHGGGSNCPVFSPDGKWIAHTRLLPDSRTAWVHRPDREDRDHFNCDFDLSVAKGGTQLCLIDVDGNVKELTHDDPPVWNWRFAWSPDGKHLVFTRAAAGETTSLWIIDADGTKLRKLCDGFEGKNADFPVWRRFETAP